MRGLVASHEEAMGRLTKLLESASESKSFTQLQRESAMQIDELRRVGATPCRLSDPPPFAPLSLSLSHARSRSVAWLIGYLYVACVRSWRLLRG
jgi:hypothetical protein